MWNKFFKNTFWLTAGEIGGRLLRIVLVLYAARVLGVANWGIFSYALSLAALFTIIADIGLGAVMTREIVRDPENKTQYLSNSLIIKTALIILTSIAIIFVTPLITNLTLSSTLLIFIALLVITDNIRLFTSSLNRALEKMHWEAIANIITQLSIMILGVWILIKNPTAEGLGISYLAGSAIGAIFSLWTVKEYIKNFFGRLDKILIKRLLESSWSIALLGVLGSIMLNTDIIMLGWLRGAEDVGYYSSAQKIIFTLYVLPSLIGTAAFPSLVKLANKNKEGFRELLEKSLKIAFLIAIPITIGGLVIGSELMSIFFGKEYLIASTTFKILLLSLVLAYPTTILGNALLAYDQEKQFLKYAGVATLGNIILNSMLIPFWGAEGAAIATVATQIISNGLIWWKLKKFNQFTIVNKLSKIFISSAIMGAVTILMYYWQINFFLIIFTSIAVYLGTLYLIKESIIFELKNFIYARPSN